jgi:hypothetical protein
MKKFLKILSLVLFLGIVATFAVGCRDHHHHEYYGYYITVINDTPWAVYVEPFGFLLGPGDRVDAEVGYDYVRVVAVRHFDGLILADVAMRAGDVLVIQ